ncbi:UNVERIFIED_CONTAM: hypothetical protein FKN15_012237 [Acipenser sinensis]
MLLLLSNLRKPSVEKEQWTEMRQVQAILIIMYLINMVWGELRYTISEEMEQGSFIGNIALDLRLDVKQLTARNARVVSEGKGQYCQLNVNTGILFVNERIDREELCGQTTVCTLEFQIILDNPFMFHSVVLEIQDINDNSPSFSENEITFEIPESTLPGARFPLESAHDPDVGSNSIQSYVLSKNDHFTLDVGTRDHGTSYGELVLEKALDREQKAGFSIILSAIDRGIPQRSDLITAYIMENNSPGKSIASVQAKDPDWEHNARVTYFLIEAQINETPVTSFISINSDSGILYSVRSFDYEQIRDFQIHVKAQDGGSPPLSSNVTVNIFVQDQNDNAPQILYPVQTEGSLVAEMVPRSADVGYLVTKVVAVDADSGQNAWLSYKLHKATDRTLFEVGLQNGEIRTFRQVADKDVMKQRLVVLVEDNGQPSRSATVTVNVAVADSFPEVLSEFSDFTQDKDYNENLTFYLVVSLATVSFLFIVSIIILLSVKFCKWRHSTLFYKSTNGNLPVIPSSYYPPRYADVGETGTLRHVYNYEVCLTTDSGKSEFKYIRPCSESLVNVDPSEAETIPHVLEKNLIQDTDPTTQNEIRLEISELALPGARFLLESAMDPDVGVNALQSYTLKPTDHFCLKTSSGSSKYVEMVLQTALDREKQGEHFLVLTAVDGGTPPRSGTVQIRINVLDANDNAPVFNQAVYKASVLENSVKGTLVTTVTATDADIGSNKEITYFFTHITDNISEMFELHPDTGEIRIAGQVDFEKQNMYEINIQAKDSGGLTDSSNVIIEIVDVNDNAPVLTLTSFSSPIPEDSLPGTVIALINVQDLDSGKNGQVRCSINQQLPFKIQSSLKNYYTLVTRSILDREMISEYNITITATDEGSPPLCSNQTITLKISDVNDNAPTFNKNLYTTYVMENNSPGLSIFSLQAEDTDWSNNARISYFLEDGQVHGKPVSSYISIKFDFALRNKGWTIKWQVQLCILCLCVADFAYGQARYTIPEEMNKGSVVGNIAHDLGLDVKRLISGRARMVTKGNNKYVVLDVNKGILVVNERIDRENLCGQVSLCSFSFEIVLENPLELHRITVDIQDVNDNIPTFPKNEIRLEISELALPGARFLLESAMDPDVGVNALQSYTLKPTDHFCLKTSSGSSKYVEMVLQTALDREKQGEHFLVLTAVDGGTPPRSGTVQIRINVLDANDNAPVFNQAVYKASVLENSVKGTLVTTVTATDADIGSNKEITYFFTHITDNISEMFELHPDTGEIRIAGQVDFEKQNMYEINVQAKDSGGLTDSCNVIIEIVDVNDNAPVLTLTSFSSPIPEDSLPGTVIALINVQDLDSGKNCQVRCLINQQLPFKIQSSLTNYYTLVTRSILDREMISEYNITITATDEGSPPLCSNQTITLKISDVNDNAPTFNKNLYTTHVMENNSPGLSIFSLQAEDSDWSNNARISYFLEDGPVYGKPVSSYISINSDNGIMYAVRSFDYEQIRDFKCHVIAKDGGSPSLSSNVTVNIFVQDQNDNGPQILYPVQTEGSLVAEMVPRSADVGYLVTKVVAVDADSGQNAWLSYKLHKATDRTLFEVGLQNGEIRTLRQVVDKDVMKQRLVVLVEDNGQPSRSATVNVNVAVADSFPEVLSEFSDLKQDKDYNDNLTFYLVVSLATVSFLFIVSFIVLLSMKLCNWRYSKLFYKSNGNLPVIPTSYYPPRYAEAGETGTLRHVYNYELCLTSDSGKSEFRFIRPCSQSVLSVEPSAAETMPHVQKEMNITEVSDLSMQ